jgi:hypothetical protein
VLSLVGGPSVLAELTAIRQQQALLTTTLEGMQRDNATIWQELLATRQRLHRQTETTIKILQFLASIYVKDKKGNLRPAPSARLLLPSGPEAAAAAGPATFSAGSSMVVGALARPEQEIPLPSAVADAGALLSPPLLRTGASAAVAPRPVSPLASASADPAAGSSPALPPSPGPFPPLDADELQRHLLELMSPDVCLSPVTYGRGLGRDAWATDGGAVAAASRCRAWRRRTSCRLSGCTTTWTKCSTALTRFSGDSWTPRAHCAPRPPWAPLPTAPNGSPRPVPTMLQSMSCGMTTSSRCYPVRAFVGRGVWLRHGRLTWRIPPPSTEGGATLVELRPEDSPAAAGAAAAPPSPVKAAPRTRLPSNYYLDYDDGSSL